MRLSHRHDANIKTGLTPVSTLLSARHLGDQPCHFATINMPPHHPDKLSKDSLDQLTHLSTLLHLLHHRNKNQHRRSVWYRHFSLFRRHLAHLLSDYTLLSTQPTTNLERTRLKAREPQIRTRIEQRLDFWESVLVPRWSRAFSQVVADGRFAVVGVVLVGIVASVCQITGLSARFEDLGQVEVERVLEEFGREAWETEVVEDGDAHVGQAVTREDLGSVVAREDEGEIVAREGDEGETVRREDASPGALPPPLVDHQDGGAAHVVSDDEVIATTIDATERPGKKHERTEVPAPAPNKARKRPADADSKPAKKKKRKKGNAIDDLFSGL